MDLMTDETDADGRGAGAMRVGRERNRVCAARERRCGGDNEMKEGMGAGELAAVTEPFVITRLRRATLTKRQRDTVWKMYA